MALMVYIVEGKAVTLNLIETKGIERQVIYDGPVYLYTRWRFDVVGQVHRKLNPVFANQFVNQAGNPVVPDRFGNVTDSPAAKDFSIGSVLRSPRGYLGYANEDGTIILVSPDTAKGHILDAKGGPYPLAFNVLNFKGSEGMYVRWAVETYVHECEDPPLILSHRWRQYVTVDDQHLTRRITNGWATFHMGKMWAEGSVPDQYRYEFLHPIPDGFKRDLIQVTPTEDGDGLEYVVIDQELTHSFSRICTNIDVKQTNGFHQAGFDILTVLGGIGEISGAASGAAQSGYGYGQQMEHYRQRAAYWRPGRGMRPSPPSAAGFGMSVGAQTIGFALGTAGAYYSSLPTYYSSIQIVVEGNRQSKRKELERIAIAIMTARLFPYTRGGQINQGQFVIPTQYRPEYEAHLTHHVTDKVVELIAVVRHRANSGIASGYIPVLTFPKELRMPFEVVVNPKRPGQIIITDDPSQMIYPPYSNGTRGTWVGAVVAQWLQGVCEPPTAPVVYNDPVSAQEEEAADAGETHEIVAVTPAPTQAQLESQGGQGTVPPNLKDPLGFITEQGP